MFESILGSGIFELIKESVRPLLRGLQRSDFAEVQNSLLNKLLKTYKRYDFIDEPRLLVFFKRENVKKELDAFRETYSSPNLPLIEAEFRAEFSTEFGPNLLDGLARDFARNFEDALVSSFPYQTGLLLKRADESDENDNAQHAKTHQSQIRSEAKLDDILKLVKPRKLVEETEQLPKTQVEAPAGIEATSPTPYLRTIEYQERDLQKYKNATEKRVKRGLDEAVEFIRSYQLKQASTKLESLRDQELVDIPNLNEIDPALRAGVYRLLGICQMRLGDLETASKNFETAKTIGGETEKLNRALLEYHTIKRDYQSAFQLAHEMLAKNPDLIEAKNALALIQLNEKNFEDVIQFYEGEPQADQDPTAQDILTIAHLQLKNLTAAIEKAQKLVELEPHAPRAYETLGNVYLAKALAPLQEQGQLYADWFREVVDKEPLHQAISNYQTSLELYKTAGQEFLATALRINLANALSVDGRAADALNLINESLENNPELHTEALLLKARFEDELGNPDLVIETCQQALQVFPDDYKFMEIMGGLHLNNKQPEVAREWLDKAEQHCQDPGELTRLKILHAKTYLFQDDQDRAWNCLQDILETEKDSIEALLATGDYFFHLKNFSEAEKCYRQALLKGPNHPGLLDKLIRFYVNFDHHKKALAYAEQFVSLVPTTNTYINYIELLINSGQYLKALSILAQTKQQGHDSAFFIGQEARCKHSLGQISEAINLYTEYLKHEPADFVATFNLAGCFQRRGERAKAIHTLEQAIKLQPDNVPVHQALAEMYKLEGNLEQAYQHARQSLDFASDDPNIHLFFFWIAHFCGHEEEAAQVLQEIPARFPEYDQLKIVGIEEAKELFASSKERYQQLKSFYQEGNLPLALVAKWLHKPLPFAWRVFCDDKDLPILSALGNFEEQTQSFEAVQANEVVVDYMALCTLYHLNLIDLPPKLFDKVYLAQGIFDQIQEDITFLTELVPPHQLERLETVSDIVYHTPNIQHQKEWLESSLILSPQQAENIRPFNEQDILLARQNAALYLLDNNLVFASVEQILPAQVTTTRKLLDYFYESGKLRQTDYEQACDYLRKTHNLHDFGTEAIPQFETIVIDHLSLEILLETNAFPLLIAEFDTILISLSTLALLNQNIGELKFYQATLAAVKEIEAAIKGQYTLYAPVVAEPDKYPDGTAFESTFTQTFVLADQLQLPLCTDDLASRKLVGSGEWGQIHTFNTRTILDLALNKKVLTLDEAFLAVLNLLRWNYQFTPINASIIFWSIQQRNFHFNDDSELLFSALDKSVTDAHNGLQAIIRDISEDTVPARFEKQMELLFNNEKIYAEVIAYLWYNIPDGNTGLRTRWTISILTRAAKALKFSSFEIDVVIILSISMMLRELDRTKLSQFLMLCTSRFAVEFLPEEAVDGVIVYILVRILFSHGNYNEQMLQGAAKLMNSLRYAQYWRIQKELQRLSARNPQFSDFLKAVQVERYKRPVAQAV